MNVDVRPEEKRNIKDIYSDAYVIDLLMPWLDYGSAKLRNDILPRMRSNGYTYISLTIALDGVSIEQTILSLARELAYFRARQDDFVLVEKVDDIIRAKREGKLAIGFHFQGTDAFARNVNMVELYYRLGIRQALLAYNQKNSVGDGCHELTDAGLSRFGRELILKMNEIGMLVDLSHTGFRTTMDAMEVATAPVIFSHSNPKTLHDHGRNITDDQAKACAATGGVVGINGCGQFVIDNEVSANGLFRMIDYYVGLIGPEHVGIGLDYLYDLPAWTELVQKPEHASRWPDGGAYRRRDWKFSDPEEVPALAEVMDRHGYGEAVIRGILGENWLRIMRQVWK